VNAATWRQRFYVFLLNQGRPREAALVEAISRSRS
jgi:hypothetical protein